jgi:MFS family permease
MSIFKSSIISNYRKLSGNTKYTVNFFIMFSIPLSLFNIYFPLYMKDRGITDNQIGYLMTITAVTSAFISLFSGRVIDKIGRKRFLFIIDCVLWPSILLLRIAAITKPFADTMLADSFNNVGRASVYAMLTFISNVINGLMGLIMGRIYSSNAVLLYCGGAFILVLLLCVLYLPQMRQQKKIYQHY